MLVGCETTNSAANQSPGTGFSLVKSLNRVGESSAAQIRVVSSIQTNFNMRFGSSSATNRWAMLAFGIIRADSVVPNNICSTTTLTTSGSLPLEKVPAASEDTVHVAWANGSSVMFGVSHEGGTFTVKHIDNGMETASAPFLKAIDNHVYVLWLGRNTAGVTFLLFRASADNGSTFGRVITVDYGVIREADLSVGSDGRNVYLFWVKANVVQTSRSLNYGQSFSSPRNISSPSLYSQEISTAAFGSNVYAVWENSTTGASGAPRYIELAVSHDYANTFHLSDPRERRIA